MYFGGLLLYPVLGFLPGMGVSFYLFRLKSLVLGLWVKAVSTRNARGGISIVDKNVDDHAIYK